MTGNQKLILPTTYYVPQTLYFAGIAGGFWMLIKGALLTKKALMTGNEALQHSGYAAIGISIIFLGFFAYKLPQKTLRCHIDSRGILISKNPQLITWDEISEIRQTTGMGYDGVSIFLQDPQRYAAGLSGWRARSNTKMVGTPAFIMCTKMGIDSKLLAAQLEEYLRTTRKAA